MISINILKKTFILFCFAAIPFSAVQPMHAATSRKNRAKKSKRKKNVRNPNNTTITLAIGLGTIVVVVGGATYLYTKDKKNNQNQSSEENQPNENSIPKKQEVLVANSYRRNAYLFDIKNTRMLQPDKKSRRVRLSPSGKRILLLNEDYKNIHILNSMTGDKIGTVSDKTGDPSYTQYSNFAWNPKMENHFITVDDFGLCFFKEEELEYRTENKDNNFLNAGKLEVSPDGKYLFCTRGSKGSFIYSIQEKKEIQLPSYTNIGHIQWDPKGTYIAMTIGEKILICEFTPNKSPFLNEICETNELSEEVTSLNWYLNGTHLALTTKSNLYIAEWDASKPSLNIGESHHNGNSLSNATCSGNSQSVAFIDDNQTIIQHSDPLKKNGQNKVSKYKINGENDDPLTYLAYGFVENTLQWKKPTELTEIKEDE